MATQVIAATTAMKSSPATPPTQPSPSGRQTVGAAVADAAAVHPIEHGGGRPAHASQHLQRTHERRQSGAHHDVAARDARRQRGDHGALLVLAELLQEPARDADDRAPAPRTKATTKTQNLIPLRSSRTQSGSMRNGLRASPCLATPRSILP